MQILGLELKCLWYDTDVLELEVCASNGSYSGCAKPYVDLHGLAEIAASLEGFPQDSSDVREVSLGAKGSEFAGGFISMKLFCRDSAGHAVLEFESVSKNEPGTPDVPWNRTPESVHFYAQIEASAVDVFVEDLRNFDNTLSGKVVLPFSC